VIYLANVVDKTRAQVLFFIHGVWLKIKPTPYSPILSEELILLIFCVVCQ